MLKVKPKSWEDSNFLCGILGHKIKTSWPDDNVRLRRSPAVFTDEQGGKHTFLIGHCKRCDQSVQIARLYEHKGEIDVS